MGRCGGSLQFRDDQCGGRSTSDGAIMAANIPAGSQSDQHGKCPGSSDGVLGAEPCCPGEHQLRDAECPSLTAHITAGDVSADCYAAESITPETNHERVLFRKLVHRYTDELETVRKTVCKLKGSSFGCDGNFLRATKSIDPPM